MKNATVEIISSDLSHQETILQIANCLDHLDHITETVFGSVKVKKMWNDIECCNKIPISQFFFQSKIDENSKRLDAIDARVDLASKKVQALSEMNKKATSIFSSAKYPTSNEFQDYESAFAKAKFDDLRAVTKKTSASEVTIKLSEKNLKGLDAREINEKKR